MPKEDFICARLSGVGLLAQALISSPPHALGPRRKLGRHSGIAAEAFPDLVRAPEGSVRCPFALARVRQTVAMSARKIEARAIKLRDPPPAGAPVRQTHDAGRAGPRVALLLTYPQSRLSSARQVEGWWRKERRLTAHACLRTNGFSPTYKAGLHPEPDLRSTMPALATLLQEPNPARTATPPRFGP